MIYATLELLGPIAAKDGFSTQHLVINRPTARDLMAVIDEPRFSERIKLFSNRCARLSDGNGKLAEFNSDDLFAPDASELGAVIMEAFNESREVSIEGDGVNEPIVYDLLRPIELTPGKEGGDVIRQVQFMAQKVGSLSAYLDATGAEAEFVAFMRGFATLLGTRFPMSSSIVSSMDFVDYLTIRGKIMGKLANSRGRWKKA